jgi:hypothetical protein
MRRDPIFCIFRKLDLFWSKRVFVFFRAGLVVMCFLSPDFSEVWRGRRLNGHLFLSDMSRFSLGSFLGFDLLKSLFQFLLVLGQFFLLACAVASVGTSRERIAHA